MLEIKPTLYASKIPMYAVIATANGEPRCPIIALSKEECLNAFIMEIISYIDTQNDIKLFFDIFPELAALYPNGDIPSTQAVYLFVTGHNMDEENLCTAMLRGLDRLCDKIGYRIDCGSSSRPITLNTALTFSDYDKDGAQIYKIKCYTPERVNLAISRPYDGQTIR